MRVLVVEDERDTAEALAWGLAAEGYVVDVAGNGVDGLWKATENAYDVIVLDVMLPGLDGYQVARRLRGAGRGRPGAGSGGTHRHQGRRPAGPDRPGGRGAGVPAAAQGTCGVQGRAARALLGCQLRRRAGRGGGPDAPAAPQDRGARPAAGDRDRPRRGLRHPGRRDVTAAPGRVTAQPSGWRRLVRLGAPGTVRTRVTAVAGLALTAAVVLGLVVMYRLQLNSADRTIQGQLRTYR